ncbi:alpha/beta hydrolase [Microbulbifer sp. OS29]|uniref:Alpha/beta hydrolase n=1 Tax=Microbulbifer okhotskensis TaxID=2926617 RepID=A0A9X2EUA2_9GAMM|nr:alpha/beta hydrolase [Microbulbifer okhotskensis]MCO1335961.1 alpha/beta hydrolase [Microbulbifer okhotskensis]
MSFSLDPEFSAALGKFDNLLGSLTEAPIGDIDTRRKNSARLSKALIQNRTFPVDVSYQDFFIKSEHQGEIKLRWYQKKGQNPGSAILYIHGGGLICNEVAMYDQVVAEYVAASGVPFLSVNYRKTPEFPYPIPIDDCYQGLKWLAQHARELTVESSRIAVMGDSAGGGLAAALAIVTRDKKGPPLARQILLYPMLDDRTVTADPQLLTFASWTNEDNLTAWTALLGNQVGSPTVSPYAAPARLQHANGLAPAFIDVGELDIFRDESIEYTRLLTDAGVSTELHVRPGVSHAWEVYAPEISVSRRAFADRIRTIRDI